MKLGDTSTAVVKVTCSYKYDHYHELKYYYWFILAGSVGGLKIIGATKQLHLEF